MAIPTTVTDGNIRRKVTRVIVLGVVLSQVAIVGLFLGGVIREPYPALILPSFDQVLAGKDGTCIVLAPRFYARLESGDRVEVDIETLFEGVPGVKGAKAFWVTGRLAPPPAVATWKPSLPSYGFQFENPEPSETFLNLLAERAAKLTFPSPMRQLEIVWDRRSFDISNRAVTELEPVPVGVLTVETGSYYAKRP